MVSNQVWLKFLIHQFHEKNCHFELSRQPSSQVWDVWPLKHFPLSDIVANLRIFLRNCQGSMKLKAMESVVVVIYLIIYSSVTHIWNAKSWKDKWTDSLWKTILKHNICFPRNCKANNLSIFSSGRPKSGLLTHVSGIRILAKPDAKPILDKIREKTGPFSN